MSNELQVFNSSEENYKYLAELTGAQVRENIFLPRLSVNRDAEDEEGKSQPLGHFSISRQNDTPLFSKECTLRVFINAYQYQEYSPVEGKYTHRSVIIKKFSEEAFDTKGTFAC